MIQFFSTFTEKNSTFINTEGKIQNTYKACNPPGFAKEDWKIIAVLGKNYQIILIITILMM